MSYDDEYEDYDEEYYEDEEDANALAQLPPARPRRAAQSRRAAVPARRQENSLLRQGVDWALGGSILAIVVITVLYVLSPVDAIPDILPVAGQADDVAAVLAGGASVAVATLARYILRGIVASRAGRIGCLVVIVLSSIGAFVVFMAFLELFGRVF
ncbi:MAG TPA: YkvA family protein [Aggregatilinea sp.]|uniref:YkvA family protein n=1 Tax=Aggregatilinea sp. TaxID=2806333 RepID=UPI002C413285|nr:YkvA family protein [Aggregatilinea sp.]HML20430.1 YkvA family protein [Aggregatilinea sp.]